MLALSANTAAKIAVAVSGGKVFVGRVAAGLLTMLALSWAAFWLVV